MRTYTSGLFETGQAGADLPREDAVSEPRAPFGWGPGLLLRRGPGRWQARPNLRMQAGGSHVDVPGCDSLAHVGYLNAGFASHASEIQVARRSRSGSGSTQMYVQVVCTPVSK